jgi:hypothetical protein
MQSPELALELRAARPLASAELRQQVRALAAERTPPRRSFVLPPLRRVALVAIPALLAVAIGGALVEGIANSGSPQRQQLSNLSHGSGAQGANQLEAPVFGAPVAGQLNGPAVRSAGQLSQAIPTLPGRLQQYGAFLRVQVENVTALSDATKRALRFAQLLGGYVAYVRYTTPAHGGGAAALIVRVPVDRVQDAIQEYSSLGTILAQNVSLLDVTKQVEEQAKEIARLEAEIARLEAGTITAAVRARIAADGARLAYLRKHKAATVARAELARIALQLTTKPKHAVATSRFQRTLSGAGGVLLREAELVLYALIVAGPLLLLGAAAIGAGRFTQRRRESQLLERS